MRDENELPADAAALARIRAATFIRDVELHAALGSTNDRALELAARADLDRPVLIWTERQTAGRGRGPNRWWSADGALTFSILLDAEAFALPSSLWPQLSLALGLAVSGGLAEFCGRGELGLKWPNDVYLRGRKVCGILVELPKAAPQQLVLGIGVNVNNSFADAPDDVRARGIALVDAAGGELDREQVLIRILQHVQDQLHAVSQDPRDLFAAWRQQCLLTGRHVRLAVGSRQAAGRCLGIDDAGALLLQTAEGKERFFAGVVLEFD